MLRTRWEVTGNVNKSRITVNKFNKVRLTDRLICDSFVLLNVPFSLVHLLYDIIQKIDHSVTAQSDLQCRKYGS